MSKIVFVSGAAGAGKTAFAKQNHFFRLPKRVDILTVQATMGLSMRCSRIAVMRSYVLLKHEMLSALRESASD